jgi:hypothetical protein
MTLRGIRVTKGTLTSANCSSSNGFKATAQYLVGLDGQQVTELDGSGNQSTLTSGRASGHLRHQGPALRLQRHFWHQARAGQRDRLTSPNHNGSAASKLLTTVIYFCFLPK